MRTVLPLVLVMALCGAAIAQEPDPQKAKEAFDMAKEAYDRGDYRESIKRLREAYRYYPDPAIRISIAKRWMDLKEPEEAKAELLRITTRKRRLRRMVKKELEAVDQMLATPVLVVLETEPPGATVRIDNRDPLTTPVRRTLERGKVRLLIEKRGFKPISEALEVRGASPLTRKWKLVAFTGKVRLTITGVPEGQQGTLSFDGSPFASGSEREVPVGTHTVVCGVAGEAPNTLNIKVLAGKTMAVQCQVPIAVRPSNWKTPVGWATVGSGIATLAAGVGILVSYAVDLSTYEEPRYTVSESSKPLAGGLVSGVGAGLIGLGTYFLLTD